MNNINQNEYEDYNKLMLQLRGMDLKEIILLFVESRTGPLEKREYITLSLVFEIAKIEDMLEKNYGDRVKIGNLRHPLGL
ncbi:hypothetical protein [Flavobacterium soyangense]|uniref:Uncharacterized protein n=1 Tax=Flavobacterium soyangense TaxID=2023265 RepID=A0A930Y123_9FLAO|nr:hypothetical protein [Flavobacterium soyangense]MBF2709009.1 hypothetical protein [Flavobacterium soyangense]